VTLAALEVGALAVAALFSSLAGDATRPAVGDVFNKVLALAVAAGIAAVTGGTAHATGSFVIVEVGAEPTAVCLSWWANALAC